MEKKSNKGDFCALMHEMSDTTYVSRRHYHEAIEIGFVLSGVNGFCVNDVMEYLEEGEISFIKSWDIHYFDIVKGTETITIIIGKEYLHDFYLQYGKGASIPVFNRCLKDKKANKKIFEIAQRWEKEYEGCTRLQQLGYVNLLLGEIAKQYGTISATLREDRMDTLSAMLEYISEHYSERIRLEDVAKYVGYSKNYCSELFHESIEQDFRNYINGVRIEAAQRMMEDNPQMRIIDVSFACGFGSLNSFYRAYRKVYNRVPKR